MFPGREQDRLACCSWYFTLARRLLGCSTALLVVVHARRTRCSEGSTTTDLWSEMYYREACECISPLGVCVVSVCVCVCVKCVCMMVNMMYRAELDMSYNRSVVKASRKLVLSGLHALCICSAN